MSAWARLRERVGDPNPIVRKELLALLRTPIYVRAVVVALVALAVVVLTTAVMVTESPSSDTTEAGKALFQVFFGATYFVMALVGPTFGATSVVGEREGRTFDALSLSALGPGDLVFGKIVAVCVAMGLIPMVAMPMVGLVLLFGGVSLAHIAVAAFWVLLLGTCGVAFGVAVSARAITTRRALLWTAPVAFFGTMWLGGMLAAIGHDYARHHSLTFEGPFFFADAYLAVPFGREYVASLVLLPGGVVGVLLWLFCAVAYGGMMEPSEDTSLPLKRWAIGGIAWLLATFAVCLKVFSASTQDRQMFVMLWFMGMGVTSIALLFSFAGEPLLSTRRMRVHPPSALTATLTPATLVPSMAFCVVVTFAANLVGVLVAVGRDRLFLTAALWATSFAAGLGGVMAWLAARNVAVGHSRARLGGVITLFVVFVGVWLLALLLGGANGALDHPSVVLLMSPTWAWAATLQNSQNRASAGTVDVMPALKVGALAWAVVAAVGWSRAVMLWQRARREEKNG